MPNFPFATGTIHIVGIAGIGMSGYAEVLHHKGYKVQGSSRDDNDNAARLRELGIRVIIGHDAQNIIDDTGAPVSVIACSTAIQPDNPEIIAGTKRKIPVISRMDLLSELMRAKWCVNVAGTHGKTTTTSLIGHVLEKCGIDPTVINGGIINAYGSNARMGNSPWMVVESDESDGTFSHLPSVASVITNIDPEHLDHHGDFESLKDSFLDYAHNLPFYGIVIACTDHPVVAEILPKIHRRTRTYGFSDTADIQAVNLKTTPDGQTFDIRINDPQLVHFPSTITGVKLPMFGAHNVTNALTCFALGHDMKIPATDIVAALGSFQGVQRRFTTRGTVDGITIIDDYAHHPVEIAATLKAGRDALGVRGAGRLIAVMQPHRYSRLADLFADFAGCFAAADEIIIADVYAAGEEPRDGIDRDHLVKAIQATGKTHVHGLDNADDLAAVIDKIAQSGDVVICMGAGSITQWAQALPAQLATIRTGAAAV